MESTEILVIDKTAWGSGPWQDEPDRVDFIHAGFACFARRVSICGHWCGYVGIPRAHPLYGIGFSRLEVDLNFHGGINYSAGCDGEMICHVPAPGMPDDVWWFGGDFAHGGDLCPGREALRQTLVKAFFGNRTDDWGRTYRALPYVRSCVEDLAEQLAAFR